METIRTIKPKSETRKVIFVDDDNEWKEALQYFLKQEHIDVRSFSSGEEALDYLERTRDLPDLIILDIDLKIGGMSGIEVAHRLRTQTMVSSPIVFLSAEPHLEVWNQQIPYSRSISKQTSFEKIVQEVVKDPVLLH